MSAVVSAVDQGFFLDGGSITQLDPREGAMSEDLLEITDTISIDETAGIQGDKDEIPVVDGAALFANLYADFGTPENLACKEGMISTPDGYSTLGWAADEDGTPLDGALSNLWALDPVSGVYEQVTLTTDPSDGKVLIGMTSSGNVAFIAVIVEVSATSSDVYILGYLPMEHPVVSDHDDAVVLEGVFVHVTVEETFEFDFEGAPAGNNVFMAFGDPGGAAIVVTGRTDGETVNSSKAGNEPTSLAANSNNINAGQGLVITYVEDMNLVPDLTGPGASNANNIQFGSLKTATEGSVTIVKVGPGNTTATVHITALLTEYEPGATFIPGIADDDVVGITAVYVNGESVTLVKLPGTETAVLTGITENDTITFETAGDHNRIVVENGGTGNARFNIGGIAIADVSTVGDGDPVTLVFHDDGPTVDANLTVLLDDDALTDGNPDGVGDDSDAENVSGTLAHDFGTDGAGSIAWLTDGAPDGFSYEAAGDDLLIKQNGVTVLTLTLNTATGEYTVTQDNPVVHASGDDENNQSFTVGYRVTDKEGDHVDGSIMIDVDDDTPEVLPGGGPAPDLEVDESDFDADATADFSGLFDVSFGADGPAAADSLGYSLSVLDASSGLTDTLTGQPVTLALEGADIVGRNNDGDEVFRIGVDADGMVTLDQSRAVVHPDPDDHDELINLAAGRIGLTATATDVDFDSVGETVDISTSLGFRDDGPVLLPIADGLVDFVTGDTATDSGFLEYGADGKGGFVIAQFTELPDDTLLGQITETLSSDGKVLTYSNANGDLFRLTLDDDAPGGYLFEVLQDAPLVLNPLDFGSVTPGGPKGSLGEIEVVFDGFLSTNLNGDPLVEYAQGNLPGSTTDDVNISTKGIGLKDNQMDAGEQLKFDLSEDVEGVQVVFDGGTGKNATFNVRMVAYDDGVLVADVMFENQNLPKGNNTLVLDFLPGDSFDEVYIFHDLMGSNGVRIKSISLYEQEDTPDFVLETTVRATDGDFDHVDDTFVISIDGNGDGLIT
jgi:hypothetical protein